MQPGKIAPASEDADPTYSYKPSLVGDVREFRLTRDSLYFRGANYAGEIPYDAVRRLRLSFRPATLQTFRFQTEIWPARGPKLLIASTSWRSMVVQERQDAAYSAFIADLIQRVGRAGGQTLYQAGTQPFVYWLGICVFAAALLGLAAVCAKALSLQAWMPAVLVAAFIGAFLWQTGGYFRRNRPKIFSPDAVPPELLP